MTQLVRYEAARYALQEARSVDEVKDVKDKAEALRLYARQANDRDMEVWTSEIKVRAVRRIGELSANLETAKNQYALPDSRKSKSDALAAAGISTSTAHEYEQIAAIPEAEFEAHIAGQRDAREPVSVSGLLRPHVANNSGNNEWYTPPALIESAREVMGEIDLDPASSAIANAVVRAAKYYSIDDDGLSRAWDGSVWMNPPYAQPLCADFCAKLVDSLGPVAQACVLVNNATETQWFQLLLAHCSAVCLLRGRVKFLDPDGNASGAPLQGQAVVYFGAKIGRFVSEFSRHGVVLVRG